MFFILIAGRFLKILIFNRDIRLEAPSLIKIGASSIVWPESLESEVLDEKLPFSPRKYLALDIPRLFKKRSHWVTLTRDYPVYRSLGVFLASVLAVGWGWLLIRLGRLGWRAVSQGNTSKSKLSLCAKFFSVCRNRRRVVLEPSLPADDKITNTVLSDAPCSAGKVSKSLDTFLAEPVAFW